MIHTSPAGLGQVYTRPLINFAVALFLFLSGYLTRKPNDIRLFYKKRIGKVIFPYVVWTIIYTITERNIGALIFNLMTSKATGTLYYIFVYIQFVLLTPFLFKLAESRFRHMGWIITPISIMLFRYYPLFAHIHVTDYISIGWDVSCLGWFSFYYMGMMLGNNLMTLKYRRGILWGLYGAAIAIQLCEGYIWYAMGEMNCGSQLKISSILSSCIFCMIVYDNLYKQRWKNKITKYSGSRVMKIIIAIGDMSFGIYLSHMLIIKVMNKVSLYSVLPFGINSIFVLAISMCFVMVSKTICGKNLSKLIGIG